MLKSLLGSRRKNQEHKAEAEPAGPKGPKEELRGLIEQIARSLVDKPNEVRAECVGGEKTIVVELTVDESDNGKVIGRKGRTAQAMRTLLSALATKHGFRGSLEILE